MHPSYTIMVPRNKPQHIIADHLVLVRVHVINPTDVQSHAREQRLPPGDGVRADHGVRRRKLVVLVEGRPAGRRDVVPAGLAGGLEDGLRARRGQGLEEFLVGRG